MDSSAEVSSRPESNVKVPSKEIVQPSRIDRLRGILAKFKNERGGSEPKPEIPKQQDGKEDYASEIEWPHGKIILELFRKGFPQYKEKQAKLKRIVDTFFNQEMANTEIFTDENGASFPLTRLNVTELASELTGEPIPETQVGDEPKIKKVFIFPSFPMLANGHQFTFVELAYKETMKALPRAIDDIKAGRITQDVEIYTFGAPTNKKWGEVSEGYVEMLQKDAYGTLDSTYAAKMAEAIPTDPKLRARTSIVAIGHSMSASMAAGSAEKLIDMGLATQDGKVREEKGLPYIQVIMDAPVTLNKSRIRGLEIKTAFGIDAAYSFAASSHVRNATLADMSGKFLGGVEKALKERGIETHEDKEAIDLKKRGLKAVMSAMSSAKLQVDTTKIHVNIRRGTFDLTIPPIGFDARTLVHKTSSKFKAGLRGKHEGFGKNLIPNTHLNVTDPSGAKAREFAIHGTHVFPIIFRQKEALLWDKSIRKISTPGKVSPEAA